jgi:uncharacterized membrane protein YbhN (UPF0104 family)
MTVEPDRRTAAARWAWARVLAGLAILAFLVWRLGTGPFLDGIRTTSGWSLAAALGIGVLTTVCCAWRWCLVSRGLGADLRLGPAIAAYYRSQFLNTVLPGGVLGDVHRGVRHGHEVANVGRGLRAVGWERLAGQAVQAGLTVAVLLALPSPVRSSVPAIGCLLVAVLLAVVLLTRVLPRGGTSWRARTWRTAGADIRDGLLARRAWPGIVLTSAVVGAGHVTVFLIAARTAGSTGSTLRLLPLALLVLLSMGIPANVGGWGPREGAAAWAFAAAGLGAAQGVAVAVVYGVMALVAGLPGAVVLVAEWRRHDDRHPDSADGPEARVPVAAGSERAARG